jgi:hypothetical protein
VAALRRQTLAEFPAGSSEQAGGGIEASVSRLAAKAGSVHPKREPEARSPAATEDSTASELARLAALHASGALSDDEFVRAKAIALS